MALVKSWQFLFAQYYHHVNPHQSTLPYADVVSTNPQRPPWPTPPMPNLPGRVNVVKPTVSTTNHSPATSGATNPANLHHHVTTPTSEDSEPPNDETDRKAGAKGGHTRCAGEVLFYFCLLLTIATAR